MRILIKGGRVIDPASGTDAILDVLIEGSVVAEIGKHFSASKADVIDANGLVVAPGFIDMHTHLREPGREDEETIESGSRSGVAGGFCALTPMANTDPVADCVDAINFVNAQAEKSAWTHIYPVGAVTRGLEGKDLTEIGALKEAGAVALSDDGHSITDAGVLSVAFECANMYDLPIISHCEDPALSGNGCMNQGAVAAKLGLSGIPSAAEETMVERDIALAKRTGGILHIAHVSCARSVELIRSAKREGVKVTAEATPHHFSLTDAAVETSGANAKMNPPLRTAADVEAVKEGLRDGTIDAIATDHAPHTQAEKEAGLGDAPFGIIGLETCLPLVVTKLVDAGVLTLSEAISRMTVGPARILNLPMGRLEAGARADVTVFDPSAEVVVDTSKFECKCRNSPFDGWRLKGRAVHVVVAGRLRLRDGRLVE